MDLTIIFLVGIIGGAFGTLTGGCSIITIPVLIFLGLPAPVAVATNRLGLAGMSLIGWYKFHQMRLIDYKIGYWVGIPAMLGSIIGANFVLQVDKEILQRSIAIISLAILFMFLFNSKVGLEAGNFRLLKKHYLIGAIFGFFLGIYGGFYGAAFATCLNYLLVILFGQTFLESAATHKIAMVFLSLMSTAIFAYHGAIHYPLGISQFLGMSLGSFVGAHYSKRIGNVWIKWLLIILGSVMAIKLLLT